MRKLTMLLAGAVSTDFAYWQVSKWIEDGLMCAPDPHLEMYTRKILRFVRRVWTTVHTGVSPS